ncbi:hypothetical protein LSH36_495g02006 [Paralvinella palmiformis]|uniref:Uncharacterized protein n=1 Tax=Paralvinella palmiformis TaxID=53620 RepID=A0AAD9MYL6_9ANNE|nr:hypothetical protein LSH36_495g02006 [Paralvinella palmiformis]
MGEELGLELKNITVAQIVRHWRKFLGHVGSKSSLTQFRVEEARIYASSIRKGSLGDSVPYDHYSTDGLAQTGGESSSISVAHLSNTNQNSSGSRQRTNSVISRRLDRSLIPSFRSPVLTDFPCFHFPPIDAYSRIERRIPIGRLYGDASVVRFHVICAGVVVLPVGGNIAIAVRAVFRFPIHPAFQFQAHPFNPNSLLSAIRQSANGIPKQQPVRNMAPLGSRSMSFNIDVIMAASKLRILAVDLRILAGLPLKSTEIRDAADSAVHPGSRP